MHTPAQESYIAGFLTISCYENVLALYKAKTFANITLIYVYHFAFWKYGNECCSGNGENDVPLILTGHKAEKNYKIKNHTFYHVQYVFTC